MHLLYERECAELPGIPSDEVTQVCLLPVAHTIGDEFWRAPRDHRRFLAWNSWTPARG